MGNSPARGNVGNGDKRVAVPAKERVRNSPKGELVGRGSTLEMLVL